MKHVGFFAVLNVIHIRAEKDDHGEKRERKNCRREEEWRLHRRIEMWILRVLFLNVRWI